MKIVGNIGLMLLFVLVFSLAASEGTAKAGNERWKAVAGNTGEERILYDPDSVIPLRPGVFRVWILGFDKDGAPRRSLEEINCPIKIVRDLEVITEKPNKPAHHVLTPSEWRGIAKESPRGKLLKILCR